MAVKTYSDVHANYLIRDSLLLIKEYKNQYYLIFKGLNVNILPVGSLLRGVHANTP
jgi:hypothetical protein